MPSTKQLIYKNRDTEEVIEDALFRHGYLVAGDVEDKNEAYSVLIALKGLFGIETSGPVAYLTPDAIRIAERNLGGQVPEPFYTGFPQSVRNLAPNVYSMDQALHYLMTYDMGILDERSAHSLFETKVMRDALGLAAGVRPMTVVSKDEAHALVANWVSDTLASKRPSSAETIALVYAHIEITPDFKMPKVASKATLVQLTEILKNNPKHLAALLDQFMLTDILSLAKWLSYIQDCNQPYLSLAKQHTLKNLNLKNQNRKLVTRALDVVFERGIDLQQAYFAYEQKKNWAGLLHHIHYKPACERAKGFVAAMRGRENKSYMSYVERLIARGDIVYAAKLLAKVKGPGALLRHLDWLLSRAKTNAQTSDILAELSCNDPTQLLQLMLHYNMPQNDTPRTFAFTRNFELVSHVETPEEVLARKTWLTPDTRRAALAHAQQLFRDTCQSRPSLGRVYIDPAMANITLPLGQASANTGVATLPRGSRIALPEGNTVRAFTYWSKVNDIDLSFIGLDESFNTTEFSWRSMDRRNSSAIIYSGDQTNGYHGGSEYFDINIDEMHKLYPELRYLVLCDNIYTGFTSFDACDVRAGYMMRENPNSGEVFEPKTIKTSFAITGNTSFAYLFAIDLTTREIVWLNVKRESANRVAGANGVAEFRLLDHYFRIADIANVALLATLRATEVVSDIDRADVAFLLERTGEESVEVITPTDIERLLAMLS